MEFIIFKNKFARYRKEKFGGIMNFFGQIFILNKKQYTLLEKVNKYSSYNSLSKEEKIIADKFLEKGVFLKLESKKAEEILKRFSKKR